MFRSLLIFAVVSLHGCMPPIAPALEVDSYPDNIDWTDVNRMSQISTKQTFPWWWNKYGCEGTQWYGSEPCRDLTND